MLTSRQKQRVGLLRRHGLGYKRIAAMTGLGRDAVRSWCIANSIEPEVSEPDGPVCAWCGARINGRARFCSPSCRHKAWRDGLSEREDNVRACAYCAKVFHLSDKPAQKYCCHACYVRDRFATKGGRK